MARTDRQRTTAIVHDHFPATMAALVGVFLTVAAVFVADERQRAMARRAFDAQAEHHVAVVGKAIDRSLNVVNAAGALFSGTDQADRWTFGDYAKDVRPRHPGLRSLQWLPRVPAGMRDEYERLWQRDVGAVGFSIFERDQELGPVSARAREEYFPVFYVEPFEGNEEALGEDMNTDAIYRAAMEKARDSGEMVATLDHAVETPTGNQISVKLFRPVYRNGSPVTTVEERQAALVGYVTGTFLIGDMLDAALREYTTPAQIEIYVIDSSIDDDGAVTSSIVYYGSPALGGHRPPPAQLESDHEGFSVDSNITAGDRDWVISAHSVRETASYGGSLTNWTVGLAGVALTVLLVLYLAGLTNRNRAIESAVDARTSELSAANRSLYREINRRRRIEGELRNAKDQADVANRAKSAFLAMVSHELRTPLNAILGFSEMMSEEVYGPVGNLRYQSYLKDISHSGEHLLGLINNILDLSKVEANEFALKEEPIGLPEIISEVLRLFERNARDGGVTVSTDTPADTPPLWADARAIRQILINLLSNAIKFTPTGGRVMVSVALDPESRLNLRISDTGIGIPAEYHQRIFQPFTQVDTSIAREYEGTGLGLPLTRSLALLHGAEVQLESKPAKGTTITIVFPLDRTQVSPNALLAARQG